MQYQNRVASAPPLATSAQILLTLPLSPNPWSTLNVLIQCLPPPRPQVLRLRYGDPAWRKSALGQWHCHFGLLRVYQDVVQCPLMWGGTTPLSGKWNAHGIVPESLPDLVNGFHLAVAEVMAKFNAISLLMSFQHFATIHNPMGAHFIPSLICQLPATDGSGRREKIHECTWISPKYLHRGTPPMLHLVYVGKLRVQYFFNRSHIPWLLAYKTAFSFQVVGCTFCLNEQSKHWTFLVLPCATPLVALAFQAQLCYIAVAEHLYMVSEYPNTQLAENTYENKSRTPELPTHANVQVAILICIIRAAPFLLARTCIFFFILAILEMQ